MDIKKYKQSVKKRREERLRLLKAKQRQADVFAKTSVTKKESSADTNYPSPFSQSDSEQELPLKSTASTPFLIKAIFSFLLVAAAFTVMNSDQPQLKETQQFINEVMHRDFNVQPVQAWYEQTIGEQPSFLPTFIERQNDQESPAEEPLYVMPVAGGQVVSTFNDNNQGIWVESTNVLPIEVISEGWVVFIGEKEGLGDVIIIDHGNGEESWYGHLEDIQVQLHEWVSQGDVIGTTKVETEANQNLFYFAMKKDSVFIDPLDVITFE